MPQRALAAGASADRWKILRTVMEVSKMQNDWKWMRGYYLEAAREKIAAGFQAALERWGRYVHRSRR